MYLTFLSKNKSFRIRKPIKKYSFSGVLSPHGHRPFLKLNENFTNNHYKIHENERPFVDVALQRYAVKKSGYYLIVSNLRIFGVTQGTFPTVVDAYDIDNSDIFTNDPVSSQAYNSEYSWATLVSVEKMTKGTHNKYFRVSNVHVENFDTRTTLYWLGKS